MARDYYAVLGVGVAASATQIRRAYQRLARRYSPDVNLWDREADALFEEIRAAYRVLSDRPRGPVTPSGEGGRARRRAWAPGARQPARR
jgi:hypothetical protein